MVVDKRDCSDALGKHLLDSIKTWVLGLDVGRLNESYLVLKLVDGIMSFFHHSFVKVGGNSLALTEPDDSPPDVINAVPALFGRDFIMIAASKNQMETPTAAREGRTCEGG